VTHGSAKAHAVSYLHWMPLYGFFERIVHPAVYPLPPWKAAIAVSFDFIALAGVALTLVAVARLAFRPAWTPTAAPMYLLALAVVFLGSRDVWEDAYNFGRVLSPLFLLAFLEQGIGLASLAPMAMLDLRISLNLAGQSEGIVRGLLK